MVLDLHFGQSTSCADWIREWMNDLLSRVLEKLIKFLAFYVTQRLVTIFTRAYQLSLSCTGWIQCMLPHATSVGSTLGWAIQLPCTLNKMHYPADKDVGRVTWFQEMMGQVPKPKYFQCLKVTKNYCGCFSCLSASITPRTASQLDVLVNDNGLFANHATTVKCIWMLPTVCA